MVHLQKLSVKVLLLLFSIAGSLFLSAAPKPELTCRILFLDGPDDGPDTLQLFDGTSSREVELPRLNFSKV